ncbi:MAG: YciI family protein [Thermoproteota archaeon]|nr:YciI family protein [Thermoproteota archaeon]
MNARNKQFLYKLIPPRSTFAQDKTEVERKVMQEHATYWKGVTDKGIALVFGLDLDPKGPWGVGIVEVADEADARALGTNDPAVKAGLTFEVYPMPDAVVRK